MHWYQIYGWVSVALGALGPLMAGPGVVKLVARPRIWRMPRSLDGSTFWGLLLIFTGLALATQTLWPEIVALVLLAAHFLVQVNDVRARRRQRSVT